LGEKQQGNPRVALPNLTLNKHHRGDASSSIFFSPIPKQRIGITALLVSSEVTNFFRFIKTKFVGFPPSINKSCGEI
jgi:hypothetical protein